MTNSISPHVCFVDLEASSAASDSWPTEIGWAFPNGLSGSCLIKPQKEWIGCDPFDTQADWVGWSIEAEKLTCISKDMLMNEGLEPCKAADVFLKAVKDAKLYTDAPEFDLRWLQILLDAAQINNVIEFHHFEDIYANAVQQENHPNLSEAIYLAEQNCPKTHRAEQDAKHLAFIYNKIMPE